MRFCVFDFEHVRQYVIANAQNTKTHEIVLRQQVDTVGVSGCHVAVGSLLVDQWISPEAYASVHRGQG